GRVTAGSSATYACPGALAKKRCLELSQPNKRWNLERLKVPDTFFWAKPCPGVVSAAPSKALHRKSLHFKLLSAAKAAGIAGCGKVVDDQGHGVQSSDASRSNGAKRALGFGSSYFVVLASVDLRLPAAATLSVKFRANRSAAPPARYFPHGETRGLPPCASV